MKNRIAGGLLGAALLASPAMAQFDLATYDGAMLPAADLKAMAEAAAQKTPPKNGDHYVIGFANLSRDIPFTQLVEQGILTNAEAAGIEIVVGDNALDGPTALSVAQSFGARNLDGVIEFQLDVNFGGAIMDVFDPQGIPVIAIDIPMPGATFFGVNNPQSGFIGGTYLAQAAIAKFGEEKVKNEGYFIVGELAQSGAVLGMRSAGQRAGIKEVLDLPDDRMLTIDTTATIEQAFSQANSVLARIPPGAPIMVTANNDQSVIGMLRAIEAAGRGADAIGVGMGADENETMTQLPNMVGSVAFFPERYGNWLVPMMLQQLAGEALPDAVLIKHFVVNKTNVCNYYDFECAGSDPYVTFDYAYPEAAFAELLAAIRADPKYAESLDVLPSE
jgi:ribose transport system substrate-binding protein